MEKIGSVLLAYLLALKCDSKLSDSITVTLFVIFIYVEIVANSLSKNLYSKSVFGFYVIFLITIPFFKPDYVSYFFGLFSNKMLLIIFRELFIVKFFYSVGKGHFAIRTSCGVMISRFC